jgi:hypothetical protein
MIRSSYRARRGAKSMSALDRWMFSPRTRWNPLPSSSSAPRDHSPRPRRAGTHDVCHDLQQVDLPAPFCRRSRLIAPTLDPRLRARNAASPRRSSDMSVRRRPASGDLGSPCHTLQWTAPPIRGSPRLGEGD